MSPRPRFRYVRSVLITLGTLLLLILIHASTFVVPYAEMWRTHNPFIADDVSRLQPTKILKIESATKREQLQAILKEANEKNWKVSIAGSLHSQGGHTFYSGAVVLNMKDFDEVLNLDVEKKLITVEAGATWDDIQRFINPKGLAIKVMQSSYVFTVGGTMSANAHGRDLDQTSFVETVDSFRLLMPGGQIVNVSRTENPELFRLVIGGYGMFGVILDATIRLTDDAVYERSARVMDYTEFPAYFEKNVRTNSGIALMLGRPSIATGDAFLKEMTVTTWSKTDRTEEGLHELGEEKNVLRDKFIFGMSRSYDWAKNVRWYLQKKIESSPGKTKLISRNNAMRPPETPLEFLDYYSSKDTDILQEYYVPVRNFVPFMDDFRRILQEEELNVLSSTIRYVKANDETDLSYCPKEDCFAIIQMSNVKLTPEAQAHAKAVTQKLVDAAAKYDGTYYLTYQLYPTRDQMRRVYPRADAVFAAKRKYDPQERFMSMFYAAYGQIPAPSDARP
jgi:decaprenylphospho-beta-D-ribofuranose 2-oxidase